MNAMWALLSAPQPPSVDSRDPGTLRTPLMEAADVGRFEVVKFLLCCWADVDARDWEGRTALMLGASSGCARTVECLLQKNPLVNIKDKDGWTAPMYAAFWNHREVVEVLLARANVDLQAKDKHGQTASDLTTCPILKGLLGLSVATGLPALPDAPAVRPPLANSRLPEDFTVPPNGLGPSAPSAFLPVKAPPTQVGCVVAPQTTQALRDPAVATAARMGASLESGVARDKTLN
jgi:hypothetical protein